MKTIKLKLSLMSLLLFFGIVSNVVFLSPPIQAASRADTYCNEKYKGGDGNSTQQRSSCKKGFSAGYDGKEKDKACKSYSGAVKTACTAGFNEGKKQKSNAPKQDGKNGAAAKKSKSAACSRYSNATNKKECEKAYDDQVKAMAREVGKQAGKSGQPSPCASVFGGTKAKEECKKAYDKAKKGVEKGKAKEGINNCAGVATFFKFDCGGASADAGGNKNPIIKLGLAILGWITTIVAVAVVGGIVYGGFLYMTAEDKSAQTQKGVTIIVDSIIALILWVFAYVVINFLVPGGLFN